MTQKGSGRDADDFKDIRIQELGRLAHGLEISRLSTEPRQVLNIDRDYSESGENLARYSNKAGTDPLTAARTLVEIGLMDKADPRFEAAMKMRLEPRSEDFVHKTTAESTMSAFASDMSNHLKAAGDRQGVLRMKAVSMALSKDKTMNASKMSESLEAVAMTGQIPAELRSRMLLGSARFADAHHLQKQQQRSRSVEQDGSAR